MASVNNDTGTTIILTGDIYMPMPNENESMRLTPITLDSYDQLHQFIRNPLKAFINISNRYHNYMKTTFAQTMNAIISADINSQSAFKEII